ncbi:MAG: MFS transporter [Deltaproteobacteria bacterium]|nr:MFS transporter [Deltaproteobacteria bacterium]
MDWPIFPFTRAIDCRYSGDILQRPIHPLKYRYRRILNWLPMGLAYAFLYFGRYNLTVAKSALGDEIMSKADFGLIFAIGAWVYGFAFLINGPLTDRIGGRMAMLIGVLGALWMNLLMGLVLYGNTLWQWNVPVVESFVVLYALNMYFQSFGAVSIVTVKAPWFHVRERGTFSTLFGIVISLGIYFAFDWGYAVVQRTRASVTASGLNENWWLFFVPAVALAVLWVVMLLWLCDRPSQAGFPDFDTGEGKLSESGEREPVKRVFRRIITHPVLMVVCMVEFCSGILRNGVMHWYPIMAKEVGFYKTFAVTHHWGLALLICGVIGGASDRFFESKRAPMAAILYVVMICASIAMVLTLGIGYWPTGIMALAISMSVIGVHGIFSGTATADFAGTKNTGAAVAIVDGMVYLGTGIQAIAIGMIAPTGEAAKNPANWFLWPLFLVPFAVIGLLLSLRIWHALPHMLPQQLSFRFNRKPSRDISSECSSS